MERHGHVGFRFHPTEEEIIMYFLERKMRGLDFSVRTIEDVVDVCMYEPWDLPQMSPMPKEDRVWYFFNAPVSKYANSKRINRTTNSGFWKVTGRDRSILDTQGKQIGLKKNLVFHQGRVPNGFRTNWVIHEYHSLKAASFPKEYVLFRLKRKSGDKPDTCNEPGHPSASDSGNCATENTNTQEVEEFETSEQEDAFVNSLLADPCECSGEISVNTLLQDFNPTKPLSGVYVRDSSDMKPIRVSLQTGEYSIVKFGKDKQVAKTTSTARSLKSSSSSDGVGSNNKEGSFISLETPQLNHKTNPPSGYLFNVLVSLGLIIFIIREMVYLH